MTKKIGTNTIVVPRSLKHDESLGIATSNPLEKYG
jgi:hypothetical protein